MQQDGQQCDRQYGGTELCRMPEPVHVCIFSWRSVCSLFFAILKVLRRLSFKREGDPMHVVILGCGYTGERVARRFLERGARVTAASRQPERLAALRIEAVRIENLRVEEGALVLHSLPPDAGCVWLQALGTAPARVVYLSTTGVYGAARVVDESTAVDPTHPRVEVE